MCCPSAACVFTASNLLINMCSASLSYTVNSISLLSGTAGHMHRNTGTTLQISGVVLLYVSVLETWGGVSHTAGPAHTYAHTGGFTQAECVSFLVPVWVGPLSSILGVLQYTDR